MTEGRLTVNGEPAVPGQKATVQDRFELDGRRLEVSGASQPVRRVLMYNKPEGEVTTRKDPEGPANGLRPAAAAPGTPLGVHRPARH